MAITGRKYHPNVKPTRDDNKVSIDKVCGNCACINEDKNWCRFHQHAVSAINYGCKTWLTQEELDAKLAEKQALLESKKAIRVNYMLTLMFAMISASYHIIIRGESMMGQLIGGKDWRRERKKALNDIMECIKKIKTLRHGVQDSCNTQMSMAVVKSSSVKA